MNLDLLTTLPGILVSVALVISTVTDIRTGKIPNPVTMSLWVLGVAVHGTTHIDPTFGLIGLAVGLVVHFTLWKLGVEKGGDAKLMIGIGALLGWVECLEATIWFAIVYLPVGLCILAYTGKLQNLIAVTTWIVRSSQGKDAGEKPLPTMLRTAPIIAVASLISMTTNFFVPVIQG